MQIFLQSTYLFLCRKPETRRDEKFDSSSRLGRKSEVAVKSRLKEFCFKQCEREKFAQHLQAFKSYKYVITFKIKINI